MESIAEIVKKYHLLSHKQYSKKLGQHFLFDMNITRKIAQCQKLTHVVEIGPGPGGLTRALLEKAEHVYAIEKDPHCLLALGELQSLFPKNLTLIEADALKINIFDIQKEPFQIMANLPYNIGTELLIQWFHGLLKYQHLESITVMLQKEVVDRIVAPHNTRAYGRLSIIAQYACHVRKEFDVSAECFTPPPKVTSSVVTLIPNKNIQHLLRLEELTRLAFGNRRKMLRNTLGKHYPNIKMQERRPEVIALEEWIEIAETMSEHSL